MKDRWERTGRGGVGLGVLVLAANLAACASAHYVPLATAESDQIEQLRENIYRVEYTVSPFTPQTRLDDYVRRRAAELTLREGYDYFHLSQRADVLAWTKRTSLTVTMYKGHRMPRTDLYDARDIVRRAEGASSSELTAPVP